MMRRFIGKIFSSQPTIKEEVVEGDASERDEKEESPTGAGSDVGMRDADADDMLDGNGNVDMEDMIRIAQEQERLEANKNEGESPKGKRKRGRKGRKSKDSVEAPEDEGERVEGQGDEEGPQLGEDSQGAMETSGANLDVQGDKENKKRGRNTAATKRKRKSMEKDTPFLPENGMLDEESSMGIEEKPKSKRGSNARLRNSKTEFVEEDTDEDLPAELKGMRHSPHQHEADQDEGQEGEEISADLADVPKKLRRAKKNAGTSPRQTVQVVIESAVVDGDLAAALHRPLTPAQMENHRPGVSAESEKEPETTPKKPSKKALGKRKASDIGMSTSTTKKQKTQKDKAAGTPPLASFGFTQSSDFERRPTPMFTPINGPKASILPASIQPRRPPVDPLANGDSDENVFVPETSASRSSERKKKRRLPVADDVPNPQTPQNPGSRNKKTPKSTAKTPQARTPAIGRSSKLSNEQVEAIAAAVEEFREEKGFSQVEMNDIIQKSAKLDTVGLWKHIFEEVSDVPHRSIQQFCRRRFHNYEARGQWTEEQDQELRDAYEKYPAKWKQIGETLNRFSEDCRDRWRNYTVCGDNLGKGAWTKEEEERLKEVVEECIKSIREMKRVSTDARDIAASDESLIDWNIVSENMGHTRSRLQCIEKWKKMKEREEVVINDPALAKPISETWRVVESLQVARKMTPKEKLLLLYAVRETGAGREGKIPWRRVKEEVPGKLKKMTMKIAFRSMRQHIEGNADMALQDIVDLLVDAYEASVPSEPAGFDDALELFQSSQKILSNKKKRKSRVEAESSSNDNGEGPSTITKPKRKPRLSEKYVVDNENEPDDIYAIPQDEPPRKSKRRKTASSLPAEEPPASSSASKNKRKLRERMKSIGQSQSQSQETDEQRHSEVSDVHIAFESLKTGNSRARRAAAKEAAKSKGKKLLSEERVVEMEDEAQPLDERPRTAKSKKAKRKRSSGKPFPSEERVVESDEEEQAAEVAPEADKSRPLDNGKSSLGDEPLVESNEEEAPVYSELPPTNADNDPDEEVSVDLEDPAVHEEEPSADETPIENAEGEFAREEESDLNNELSENETDFSNRPNFEVDADEIDLDKHGTATALVTAETYEAEPPVDEETQSQDGEDFTDQNVELDKEEPSIDESENDEQPLADRNAGFGEEETSEDESKDEEELLATQDLEAGEDAMDVDKYETTYTAPGGPEAEDDESSMEDEEEKSAHPDQESVDLDEHEDGEDEEITLHHDQESVDLDAARDTSANEYMETDEEHPRVAEEVHSTNGFHEEERSQNYGSDADTDFHGFQTEAGSVDLDTHVKKTPLTQSTSPLTSGGDTPKVNGFLNSLANEYANGYKYHEEVSSDDDDMSDIPAKIVPKAKLVETKKERKPKKDKKSKSKSKSKSKKRVSGFK